MFSKLIKWSNQNYSDLPWRKNRSLYTTLVSEIMLQQTTVSTVLNHFDRFLDEYPTVNDLAKASEEQVCISWKGLGYYRRARNLRKAAIDIVENFEGKIPTTYDDLVQITGVGAYTANALISIGNNKKALAIDANIERVIARIYGIQSAKGPKLHQIINELLNNKKIQIKKSESFRELNESLMDLGRVYCQARKVSCQTCPMNTSCLALKSSEPLSYPELQVAKVKKYHDLKLLRLIVENNGKYLGFKKSKNEWLSDQVELPTFVISCDEPEFSQYEKLSKKIKTENLPMVKTSITKYKIENYIKVVSQADFEKYRSIKKFKFLEFNAAANWSTATSKVLKQHSKE